MFCRSLQAVSNIIFFAKISIFTKPHLYEQILGPLEFKQMRLDCIVQGKSVKLVYVQFPASPSQCGAADSGSNGSGFETRLCHLVFPLGKEISRHC